MEKKTAQQVVMSMSGIDVTNGDAIEMIKLYARQYAKNLPIYRIFGSCNTEFELIISNGFTERVSAFQNCTHCNARNDTWISIRLNEPE